MTTTTEERPTVVTTSEAIGRSWHRLDAGVRTMVLWSAGDEIAGLLVLEPGASIEPHAHQGGSHHLYVIEGRCRVGDRLLAEGGYVHVHEGVARTVRGDGQIGCRLVYVAREAVPRL